jgi:hypothetical protein
MEDIPPYARFVAIGLAVAAAIGLLVNHFVPDGQSVARLMLMSLGPIVLLLGIGGAVEPKVLWALGKYGEHLPAKYRIIGGCLGGVGLLLALALIFLIYPFRFGP